MGILKRGGGAGGTNTLSSITLPTVVVFFLVAYFFGNVGVQLFRYTGRLSTVKELPGEKVVTGVHEQIAKQNGLCNTIEDFIEDGDYSNATAENPWRQMKWGLPPAKCRVNGHLIERLDPVYNYRRGVALGFTNDPDDKTHIEHWFLGTKVDLNKRKRRVFIDLGANYFSTSIVWFSQRYPCDFTEVHAFEADGNLFSLPAGFDEETNWLEAGTAGFKKIKGRDGFLPSWMIKRIHFYNKYAGVSDDAQSVNITRFIKDELKLTEDDTVVIKMDIEGSEWPILRLWVNDPDMPKIIDELWAEVHYYQPPDNDWTTVKDFSRDQTTRILAEMRLRGWYVHYWD